MRVCGLLGSQKKNPFIQGGNETHMHGRGEKGARNEGLVKATAADGGGWVGGWGYFIDSCSVWYIFLSGGGTDPDAREVGLLFRPVFFQILSGSMFFFTSFWYFFLCESGGGAGRVDPVRLRCQYRIRGPMWIQPVSRQCRLLTLQPPFFCCMF